VRKILSILFLGLFLFNTGGYYFVFRYNQSLIRDEIKGMIRSGNANAEYTVLRISSPLLDPGFKRIDRNEFRYHGRMYDIIREVDEGDATLFYCINDTKEESLLAGYDKILKGSSEYGSHEKSNRAHAILYHIITLAIITYQETPVSYPLDMPSHAYVPIRISQPFHIPVSPPPEA
jgi:hypothetical protein